MPEHYGQNDRLIDLHTHTTASDGSMTPTELVRHAFEKGLAAIAITDHDSMEGIDQALEEGKTLGIEVIAGVEISVDFDPEMHLLGYFFNGHYDSIQKTLEELRQMREQRNPRIISKLNELGLDITMDEVNEIAGVVNVGRPHIARTLMVKGYVGSIAEAFEKYLSTGRPAYFKKDKLTPEEGVGLIARSGGVPVLAHPIYLDMAGVDLEQLLPRLKAAGLKGIEAIYTENTEEQTERLLKLAGKNGLAVSGGSDFHGSYKPYIEIGVGRGPLRIPYELLDGLRRG
ncbi:MAG TPA: PHP domain-containing protein [Clostridia bacterium]|nr:PHP domain-containing protein [Clostridia bacterium]